MWLLMAAGTVAFWLGVVWVVKEVFSPHEHSRHRTHRPDGHPDGHPDGDRAGSRPIEEPTDGGRTYQYPPWQRAAANDARVPGPADPWLADKPGSVAVGAHAMRDVRSVLDVLEQRLARGEIDVDEYARIRRALIESNPALSRDAGS